MVKEIHLWECTVCEGMYKTNREAVHCEAIHNIPPSIADVKLHEANAEIFSLKTENRRLRDNIALAKRDFSDAQTLLVAVSDIIKNADTIKA